MKADDLISTLTWKYLFDCCNAASSQVSIKFLWFLQKSQMNHKSNHCADNVMIWLQTIAKIILLQVLFCRDCAGFFGVSLLIWDLMPDNLLTPDLRPWQPPAHWLLPEHDGPHVSLPPTCMRATSTRRPWNSLTSREKGLSLTTITRRGIYESSPSSFSSPRVRGASGRRSSARCQTYISHKLIY